VADLISFQINIEITDCFSEGLLNINVLR